MIRESAARGTEIQSSSPFGYAQGQNDDVEQTTATGKSWLIGGIPSHPCDEAAWMGHPVILSWVRKDNGNSKDYIDGQRRYTLVA